MNQLMKVPKTSNEDGIVLFAEKALEFLRMANDLDQVQQIKAQGIACRAALRELAASKKAQAQIEVLVLRAELRIGEMTREMPTAQGERSDQLGFDSKPSCSKRSALAEAGISKKQAHEYEALADMPESELQCHIDDLTAEGKPITRGRVLARSKAKADKKPRSSETTVSEKNGKDTASRDLQRVLQLLARLSSAELLVARDALRKRITPSHLAVAK